MQLILKNIKKQYLRILFNLVITFCFLAYVADVINLPIMKQLENIAYDYRVVLSMPNKIDDRIVIVDIDEKSLAEIGRWPWGRDVVAELTDKLFEHYQVFLVGFNIVFAEADKSSGLEILDKLSKDELKDQTSFVEKVNELRTDLDFDYIFSQSLKDRRVILGYYFNNASDNVSSLNSGALPNPILRKEDFDGINLSARTAIGYGGNLEIFQTKETYAGHFDPWIDNDGVVRRAPLLYKFEGNYYESLALAMVRALLGVNEIKPVFEGADDFETKYFKIEWLEIADLKIPVDEYIQALIPYRGKQGSFKYISATDVLNKRIKIEDLENRIVIFGTSAPGLFDLSPTPVQNKFPGVEIHANLISGILDERIKQQPSYTRGVDFLQVLIIGIILSLVVPCFSPLIANIFFGVCLSVVIGLNLFIWQVGNHVLPIAPILMMMLILYLFNMTYGFFTERRGKKEISGLFGQYIPGELVQELSENPRAASMEAENREMSVLFTDVRGFTTISEGMKPTDLSNLMNAILTPLTAVIHKNRGTIDKYMGDAIMAFWGAPLEDKDHAKHALQAGYEMIERLQALKHEFQERGWPEINLGIGINTGIMSVGNMGSEFRMAYTVLGDNVNLGSRLEGLTSKYGEDIIVSESTVEAVPEYLFKKLDRVRVKGKNEPVTIYKPIALREEVSQKEEDEINEYEKALKFYYSQDWENAKIVFNMLRKSYLDRKTYNIYLERIEQYINEPPPENWDGVYTHTTK